MAFQVALLSSEEHCEYIRSVAERLELPFELDYKAYDRTRELPAFFSSIEDRYDAFCTTGAFSRLILKRTHPECTKPVACISESVAEFYRILLSILYKNRDCDMSRILFDHSLWLPEKQRITALDYMEGLAEFDERSRREAMERVSLEQLLDAESLITDRAMELRRQGLLDLVVCRHSHAYQAMKRAGIPCVFAYPTAGNISETLRHLGDELNLIRMGENLPGVILLSSPALAATGPEDVTAESIALQRCLLDFDQENTAGMLIKKTAAGFELYSTRHTMQRLTQGFGQCILGKYILGRLGQKVDIGYGIGNDIMAARSHAAEALEEARKTGKSWLIDESGTDMVPLSQEEAPAGAGEVYQMLAGRTGLSAMTLQRISAAMDLLGRKELTTQELAGALQVTVANANRFMNQLQAAGAAVVVGEKKAPVRGRPTRIYEILF